MIAIDVTMIPTNDQVENSPESMGEFVNLQYREIVAFFQDCIDESLILNLIDNVVGDRESVTTYYSTSIENAQLFEQKFQDLSAEFSIRKFWNQHGFDTTISMKEIDFNYVEDLTVPYALVKTPLIDKENSEIWGVPFPFGQ